MRSVKSEHRGNWGLAYQDLTVMAPSPTEIGQIQPFLEAGVTHELVVHLLEEYVPDPAIDRPIPVVVSELKRVAPFEVATVEQYQEYKAKKDQAKAKRAEDLQKGKQSSGRQQGRPKSNVFLHRDGRPQDDGKYDHIFKKFDD